MPENTMIEHTFTYSVPDEYLHQTSNLNKTNRWTYRGPDKLWIWVHTDTGKPISAFHLTEKENGADYPSPEGQTKVLVEATRDPEIASMIYNRLDYGTLEQVAEELPDGSTYAVPNPLPPDHTYEFMDCVYNVSTKSWNKPLPWKKPHMTWDELKAARVRLLQASDTAMVGYLTEEKKAEWEAYRQKLRDITTTFAGIDPWKVPFPRDPNSPPIE